jgi:hypothetical protein
MRAEPVFLNGLQLATESADQTIRGFHGKIHRENKKRLLEILPQAIESTQRISFDVWPPLTFISPSVCSGQILTGSASPLKTVF